MQSKYVKANQINLHFIENDVDRSKKKETLILMHGLTANAFSFSSVIEKLDDFHVISVDLRGRGLSDKPKENYSMNDHAKDIIGLMDALNIDKAVIGGHSFGARLSIFIAAMYPDRVKKVILMDAAVKVHPDLKEMVMPSLLRLGKVWNSFEEYLLQVKEAQYLTGKWSDEYLPYFKADVKEIGDGKITTNSTPENIAMAVEGVLGPEEEWMDYIRKIKHPTILINATGAYAKGEPLLPKELAMETVERIKDCKYQHVSGNHLTMLFGKGSDEIANVIVSFLKEN